MTTELELATKPDRPDDWDKQETIEDTVHLWMAWIYRDLIAPPDTGREREHGEG